LRSGFFDDIDLLNFDKQINLSITSIKIKINLINLKEIQQ